MKTVKAKNLDIKIPKANAFAFETDPDQIKLHTNMLFNAKRGMGKTTSAVNLLEKLPFDRIFVISPSIKSNHELMKRLKLEDSDIYEDPDDISCLGNIIKKIEQERDDLEEYREKMKRWNELQNQIQFRTGEVDQDLLLDFYNAGRFEKPQHRWNGKVPCIAILFDDVVGSMLFTKGIRQLNKLTIYHRHIGQFKDGGAVGCSLFFLVQSYKAQAGGISKCIRNNITHMALWRTKNKKELEDISQEMSGEVDQETFYKLYEYATQGKHDFLFIDLHPKDSHPSQFRRNFNEFLIPNQINDK